jgi:alkanesulfonate monooxygenase SsuD/methylene tetrahydromethanopterin reductase-like flavin-dependent oxidoreductase (luciferase family)
MIDESMYLIPKIMTQDEIEHDGEYIKIPRRPIHPKPLQKPHPPLYYACTREATLELAGRRGIGALVLGFSGPEEIARKNEVYRENFRNRKIEDQVGIVPTEHLAAFCAACVLDDRDEARRIGLRGQRFFAEAIAHWYQGGPKPSTVDLSEEEQREALAKGREAIVTYLSEEAIGDGGVPTDTDAATSNYTVAQDAYGDADDCIRYVTRLQDAGADEVLFLLQMGTIPHSSIMETIRNIGTKVIPHFRDQVPTALAAE